MPSLPRFYDDLVKFLCPKEKSGFKSFSLQILNLSKEWEEVFLYMMKKILNAFYKKMYTFSSNG